jgi:transmembrane sensor
MTPSKDPLGQDGLIAEAARWFASLDAGTAREEEFEAWRNRDPAHAVAYARVVGNWESIGAGATAEEIVLPVEVSRRGWLRMAAVGLPVAVIGSSLLTRRAYAWQNAATRVGETRRIDLPDGSVAYLNTDSALSWRFAGGERTVRLDRGEVALDVRNAGTTALSLNGRSFPLVPGLFDARVSEDQLTLTLVNGTATHVPGADTDFLLRANETLSIEGDGTSRVKRHSPERIASLIAWRAGEIVFLDETLADATAGFNRYLTRKIRIGNQDLAREKIGGRFDLDQPDLFLKAVSLALGARVLRTEAGFTLTR